MIRFRSAGGLIAILLGFGCYVLGSAFDDGFFHGFFQGTTIALMISGAYLLGAALWRSPKSEGQLQSGAHWLPSRDSTPTDTGSAPSPDGGTASDA